MPEETFVRRGQSSSSPKMDDFEKNEKNDHNPPYHELSDINYLHYHPSRTEAIGTTLGNDFSFHPSRSQVSDPTLGNDFYSHPSLLEASGSTLANKMSPCITNIEFEIAHINLNQTSHCLKVGNQGLSQPDKEKILELF